MDWQLPDIGKTTANNTLPSSLSEHAVRIMRYSHLVGYFRAFPYRVVLFPWIRIGLYIVGTIRFNSTNHVGHLLNDYSNQTNPQCRRRCKIIITQKKTCLISGSTNITKYFLQVMCEL